MPPTVNALASASRSLWSKRPSDFDQCPIMPSGKFTCDVPFLFRQLPSPYCLTYEARLKGASMLDFNFATATPTPIALSLLRYPLR